MKLVLDAFWRAAAYCLHPRVIALSVLPLVLMVVVSLGLGYLYWDRTVDLVNATLQGWPFVTSFFTWLEGFGLGGFRSVLAPLIIVFLATPLIVVMALLAVSVLMTPAMLHLVAQRRFPDLERRHGGSWWRGALVALVATAVALLAMVVSIPLWLVPPLVLVIPPLIWGWLTYRVLGYDVLAEHASREERRELVARHRMPMLAMGVVAGLLGAAPGLLWVSGGMFVALAPVLVPAAIWIYTLVFAFAALWFAHFALAALAALRLEREPPPAPPASAPPLLEPVEILPPP
ncbi:EI24 domain-containing protein [Piscinibacter sp.]|uniref:EI24 domain-containing protein n=1 Tax=Piscinibacter sp. TaxID=1903157 RepID=UPI0039E2B872